ncbi:MAG: glycoside hydrolase family 3 protein, partial [Bacilli bacterium]|nr:glycoside hydrolase family 3 protein [Bacilli bacterium]
MKAKILHGTSIISIFLLGAAVGAHQLMEAYPNQMDQVLGTKSSTIEYQKIGEGETVDPWNFKSQFKSAKEAIEGYKKFAIKEAEETFALLKNNNSALPLSSSAKVTLFGLRSYAPVYGNSAGSIADKNTIDTYHTQIYNAFKEKGFHLNPSMLATYESYFADKTWGGSGFGATPPEYKEITKTNEVAELSPTDLAAINANYKQDYGAYKDAAIVVVGRPGGESKEYYLNDQGENTTTGNIMGLSTAEKAIIAEAKANFDKVIVLINATNTMEIKELKDDPDIDAIMWIGFPGPYGFYALADVLNGTVSPSAYLTDTHVTNAQATPAMQNFGKVEWPADIQDNGNNINSYLVNAEGIYSGYRYFETRYAEIVNGNDNAKTAKAGTWTQDNYQVGTSAGTWDYNKEVVYPFGYGLSYTTFKEEITSFSVKGDRKSAEVKVKVTNTGSTKGKHAVQLYVQTPYTTYDKTNNVEKSAIQLVDFEKTGVLEPNSSQTITLNVEMENLASYDYTKAKTFILDEGDYYFALGTGSHDALNNVLAAQGKSTANGMDANGDASKVHVWNLGSFDDATFSVSENGTPITNRLSEGDYAMDLNAFLPGTVTYLSRQDFNGTFPKTYSGITPNEAMLKLLRNDFIALKSGEAHDVKFGQESTLNLIDLKGASWDDERWEELVNKVTIDEFLDFASHAFHHIQEIPSVGYAVNDADDGPGGSDTHYFHEGTYQGTPYADAADYAESKPGTRVGPSQQNLAASFNKELAFENGEIILGETSIILTLPIMIGPGGNLHRHGYNGRGGEYYSEDPILSGYIGSATVQGAQSKGCLVNIKHAAFNDQEINR